MQENNPQLLLPKKCFDAANARDTEAELSDWSSTCAAAAAGSTKPECKAITKEHPKYKCTYKSLSGFYQIQQVGVMKHSHETQRKDGLC